MTSLPPTAPPDQGAATCPSCGADAFGRFCATCGAPLAGATCPVCKGDLTPGSNFCHHCGTASGPGRAAATSGKSSSLPWIVAALALLTMFAMLAGRGFNNRRGSTLDAPQNALPQAGLDDRAPDSSGGGPVRAPDISSLSPTERADRLFNKVMLLYSQGKADSVQFFAPMALTSYQMLGTMNNDQHYDMGRVAEVAGAIPLAKAQADTILKNSPTHLLGLILAAGVAGLQGDSVALRSYEKRLVAAEKSELAKKLDEYDRHQDDITNGIAEARKAIGAGK
ncbi:MAG: zinc ribbon domain-containing protein [Gemmatimonadota bacterium]|nr:zinc ribbon domain-containing protein [Gemmatimonadota bacterium]